MPECDICGSTGEVRKMIIEGATVSACRRCQAFGKDIPSKKSNLTRKTPSSVKQAPFPAKRSENYRRMPSRSRKPEKMLIDNFGEAITQARSKKGLSRRELGMQINERESLLVRIEHERLTPSDSVIDKIERALDINLYTEAVEDSSGLEYQDLKTDKTTLGLVAKIKRKQKK